MSLKKFLILSGLIFSITVIPVSDTYAQSQQGKAKTTQSKKKQVKAKKSRSNANKSSSNQGQRANNNPCSHVYVGERYKFRENSANLGFGRTTYWVVTGMGGIAVSLQNVENSRETFEADCRKLPVGDYAEITKKKPINLGFFFMHNLGVITVKFGEKGVNLGEVICREFKPFDKGKIYTPLVLCSFMAVFDTI